VPLLIKSKVLILYVPGSTPVVETLSTVLNIVPLHNTVNTEYFMQNSQWWFIHWLIFYESSVNEHTLFAWIQFTSVLRPCALYCCQQMTATFSNMKIQQSIQLITNTVVLTVLIIIIFLSQVTVGYVCQSWEHIAWGSGMQWTCLFMYVSCIFAREINIT
jgi:hypothetical protein